MQKISIFRILFKIKVSGIFLGTTNNPGYNRENWLMPFDCIENNMRDCFYILWPHLV